MKTIKKATAFFSVAAICCLVMAGTTTQAKNDGEGKRQLTTCSLQSGGVVTQIGNTCDGKGSGCIPNPCS